MYTHAMISSAGRMSTAVHLTPGSETNVKLSPAGASQNSNTQFTHRAAGFVSAAPVLANAMTVRSVFCRAALGPLLHISARRILRDRASTVYAD